MINIIIDAIFVQLQPMMIFFIDIIIIFNSAIVDEDFVKLGSRNVRGVGSKFGVKFILALCRAWGAVFVAEF